MEKEIEFEKRFHDISDMINIEFQRNLDIYGSKIKCTRGCSACCSQVFRITPLDAQVIINHISKLDEKQKADLISKAAKYKPGMPCPALGKENECSIYPARPIVCRRFGIPIYDYKNPGKINACNLNFADGEEINDPLLILNQTEIGLKWDKLKEDFQAFNNLEDKNFTIAEAILQLKIKLPVSDLYLKSFYDF